MTPMVVVILVFLPALLWVAWWWRGRAGAKLDVVSRQALDWWRQLPPDRCGHLLREAAADHPDCGVIWYLLGMSLLARGDVREAVRAFQVCYHRQPALATAALLVFAGQKLDRGGMDRLLHCLVQTWPEMGCPPLERHPRQRRLLDELSAADSSAPANASPLARTLWRLPLPQLRQQLAEELSAQEPAEWSATLFADRRD
jgi:hypothetical protein